jgi:hypothetical protein
MGSKYNQIKNEEGVSPENSEFSSASLSGTDIALHNSESLSHR